MLNCSYCDYYSVSNGKRICEFADHLFLKNPNDMDVYPCSDSDYNSYLLKQEKSANMTIVA